MDPRFFSFLVFHGLCASRLGHERKEKKTRSSSLPYGPRTQLILRDIYSIVWYDMRYGKIILYEMTVPYFVLFLTTINNRSILQKLKPFQTKHFLPEYREFLGMNPAANPFSLAVSRATDPMAAYTVRQWDKKLSQ